MIGNGEDTRILRKTKGNYKREWKPEDSPVQLVCFWLLTIDSEPF